MGMMLYLTLAFFISCSLCWKCSADTEDREAVIAKVLNNTKKSVPPDFEEDYPTNVTIQLYIVGLHSISESSMDYAVTVFLRQSWLDKRMAYRSFSKDLGVEKLEIEPTAMKRVWVPDLFFTNEKRAAFHTVTVPNKLMQVSPDGQVLYSSRISMTLSCDMDLSKFPFDKQLCSLVMESYSYSTKNVAFHWHQKPVERRKNLKLSQFNIEKTDPVICTKEYEETGTFTCIRADFHLKRNYGYYIAQVYTPSVLIVALSWVSFWLDIDSVPARVSLGLLTVLTMTTQSASARANLPRVSYIKAIDVWMAMCLFFVFAALVEFAYVNVNARIEKRKTTTMDAQGSLPVGKTSDNNEAPKRLFSKTTISRAKARHVDKVSRVAFPGVFLFFNIVYWLVYMIWEPSLESYDG